MVTENHILTKNMVRLFDTSFNLHLETLRIVMNCEGFFRNDSLGPTPDLTSGIYIPPTTTEGVATTGTTGEADQSFAKEGEASTTTEGKATNVGEDENEPIDKLA